MSSHAASRPAYPLQVEGDLLLQSPLEIADGKGWTLDVRGTLRIAGAETVA